MVDFIILDETHDNKFSDKTSGKFLGPFVQMNVFVGKNNSGKSRFLRTLFNGNKFSYFSFDFAGGRYIASKNRFINYIQNLGNPYGGTLSPFRSKYVEFGNELKVLSSNEKNHPEFIKFVGSLEFFSETNNPYSIPIVPNQPQFETQIKELYSYLLNEIKNYSKNHEPIKNLYIPILRGLRPIHYDGSNFTNQDVYTLRTKSDYQFGTTAPNIYTGLSIYEDIKKLLLGTEEERQKISEFQKFLENFIFHERVTLIPKYDADVLHIKIGSKPQHEIYNLGDGLQTIIAILYPIFNRKDDETLVFIEEPETHLHPEWQQKLIKSLKYFTNHQFFISSHSTAFINDPDSSIFSIKNEEKNIIIENLDKNAKIEVIKELGYKPSDLVLANYILWVEGPSDKIYIQEWLTVLAPDLKEGVHYSIMVIGGENYRHLLSGVTGGFDLSLIKSLNPNYGIILDSDKKTQEEELSEIKQRIKDGFAQSNSFCWITNKREIENYISNEAFKQAVIKYTGKTNIEIKEGDFEDRFKITDNDQETNFKSTIKLPEAIFTLIQKDGIDAVNKIPAKLLKDEITKAVKATSNNSFSAKKMEVAKAVVKIEIDMRDPELYEKMTELVTKIKEANN